MGYSQLTSKIKRRLWHDVVKYTRTTAIYPLIYKSYWHALLHKPDAKKVKQNNYFSAVPNPGAGIGHQLANWIAAYWYAEKFGLRFAHIPFSTEKWECFLGFGEDEISVEELVKKQNYKKVLLPLFDEFKLDQIELMINIIESYSDKKVVFVVEQDQSHRDQFGVMEELKQKFYHAKSREDNKLIYSEENFNIAIHVRRGDIIAGQNGANAKLQKRWQDNSYFEKVLSKVIGNLHTDKPIAIYLFSQGKVEDFKDFDKFENLHFCLDMGVQDSFLHMVYADLLITSKSSFSYKPALISNGIKICPSTFWHNYPETDNFILANDDAVFDEHKLFNVN